MSLYPLRYGVRRPTPKRRLQTTTTYGALPTCCYVNTYSRRYLQTFSRGCGKGNISLCSSVASFTALAQQMPAATVEKHFAHCGLIFVVFFFLRVQLVVLSVLSRRRGGPGGRGPLCPLQRTIRKVHLVATASGGRYVRPREET